SVSSRRCVSIRPTLRYLGTGVSDFFPTFDTGSTMMPDFQTDLQIIMQYPIPILTQTGASSTNGVSVAPSPSSGSAISCRLDSAWPLCVYDS
ncbi:hypothetical protein CH063_10504, partial [Colletotrichum higginsianum]